jgi:hypothetical protein
MLLMSEYLAAQDMKQQGSNTHSDDAMQCTASISMLAPDLVDYAGWPLL